MRRGPIYIAGPMTGLPEYNFPAFHAAEARLLMLRWEVENPTVNGADKTLPWDWYMRRGIEQVVKCNSIALLPGWEKSRGAKLEVEVALALDMDVYLVYPNEPDDDDVLMPLNHVEVRALMEWAA